MIPIKRLPAPDVLARNEDRWRTAFLEQRAKDPQKRPSSKQYAHPDIVSTLEAMSHHKCFYCEQSTKQTRREVDHYIDVAEDPTRAFMWTNLYLACWECNHQKQPHRAVPVTDCLDPCAPDTQPSAHLMFEKELIRAREGSAQGLATIKKYRLDRKDLDHKRLKQLQLFNEVLVRIKDAQIADGRKDMNDDEKALLRSFCQPDFSFSLMFQVYLERHDL
ncbi:HNH endonuclease [Sorangium sp. So ce834]|uniref:HNH endonuclease n=1 Tax=Sorangium sp. So ce834 TaxID=3133321 RepID=UPI003F61106B